MIKKYKDFIDDGSEHRILYIDDDYVLKMPKKYPSYSSLRVTSNFDDHIRFMQKYPDIFPDVKKLDKYRASVEYVDVKKAVDDLAHLAKISLILLKGVRTPLRSVISKTSIMHILYNVRDNEKEDEIRDILYSSLKEYGKTHNDIIINKWIDFLDKLKANFNDSWLDLHSRNFGINKNNHIKLIDF